MVSIVKNIKTYEKKLNNFIHNFVSNIDSYKFSTINTTVNEITRVNDPNAPIKEIDGILTDFVVNTIFENDKYIKQLYNDIIWLVEHCITKYKEEKNIVSGDILFISKGGLILTSQILNLLHQQPKNVSEYIKNKYNIFKRSDFDFLIHIEPTIKINGKSQDESYNIIYDEITLLMYYVLKSFRDFFKQNKIIKTNYFKYSDEYKNSILDDLINKLNESKYVKDNNIHVCKIVYDNNTSEKPCTRDVSYDFDSNIYDKIITAQSLDGIHNNNKLKLVEPNIKRSDFIISYNDNISFINNDIITKFNLVRIKLPFLIYYNNNDLKSVNQLLIQDIKSEYNKNIRGGELIDISIPHKNNTHSIFDHNIENIMLYGSNTHVFNIEYQINDLKYILFETVKYPWDDNKFKKRINRLFLISILNLINNTDDNELQQLKGTILKIKYILEKLFKIKTITKYKKEIDGLNLLLLLNFGSIKFISQVNYFEFFSKIKITFENIKNETNIPDGYYEFIRLFITNINNLNEIIDKINTPHVMQRSLSSVPRALDIESNDSLEGGNQSGGFKICNKSNDNYILPSLLNIITNFNKYNIIKDNIQTVFNNCYDYLIILFSQNITRQKYYDILGNVEIDSDFRDIPSNNINISALAFISYLIEYNSYLILYNNIKPNTESNPNNNTLKFNWSGKAVKHNNRPFRDNTFEKGLIEHFNSFCTELTRVYNTFIKILVKKLYNLLKTELNLMPTNDSCNIINFSYTSFLNIIFSVYNKKVNIIDKKDIYNYIRYNWKYNLAKKIINFNLINDNRNPGSVFKDYNPQTDFNKIKHIIYGFIDKIIYDSIKETINLYDSTIDYVHGSYNTNISGFFSWINMLPDSNRSKKYGSCITSTFLETYFLNKLYEPPTKIKVCLQSHNIDPTNFKLDNFHQYYYTNSYTKHSHSHWATKWNCRDKNGNTITKNFRVFPLGTGTNDFKSNLEYNFTEKKDILLSLTMIQIDIASNLGSKVTDPIEKQAIKDNLYELFKSYTTIIEKYLPNVPSHNPNPLSIPKFKL